MRVVHVATYDAQGGAARGAYRLHRGLCRIGHSSSMLVATKHSEDPTVQALKPETRLLARLVQLLYRASIRLSLTRYRYTRPAGYESFSDDRSQHGSALLAQLPPCDVVNLHWVAGFVDHHRFFSAVPAHTPVAWRLSDLNPLTGGCHYSAGCHKYRTGCEACPQLGSTRQRDLAWQIWQRKKASYGLVESWQLHLVAQSQWIAGEIGKSKLLGRFPVTVIPNGLDVDTFSPNERHLCRSALGIADESRVVLFISDLLNNRRKGFSFLVRALALLESCDNTVLLSLGIGEQDLGVSLPRIHLGRVTDDHLLALIYGAADLFIIPSLEDNLPNTVLESMACGTPVVGFDVGGIPDMVRPGETGLLVPKGDVNALRDAIARLLRDHELRGYMSSKCRRVAVEEYALEVQARRYADLYESMQAQWQARDQLLA